MALFVAAVSAGRELDEHVKRNIQIRSVDGAHALAVSDQYTENSLVRHNEQRAWVALKLHDDPFQAMYEVLV